MCTQHLLEYFQNSQYSVLTWVIFLSTRFIPAAKGLILESHQYIKTKFLRNHWTDWTQISYEDSLQ